MIPKIIHYVWLGGEKPELFYKCLESWKKFCPDYEIKEWNEKNFDFSGSLYATQAYEEKKYGFVPDYIRAKVLYEYGGIYLDTDVEIVKSFDDLLNEDFITSFENEAYIETAILGSCKGHPFPKMMADFYLTHPFKKGKKIDFTPSTPIWTNFLIEHYSFKMKNSYQKLSSKNEQDDKTVTIYPNDYFCPINYTSKEMHKTENTYAIHYFSATWFTQSLKRSEKFLKGLYKVFGKHVFGFFTRLYTKNIGRRLKKEWKKNKKLELNMEKKEENAS